MGLECPKDYVAFVTAHVVTVEYSYEEFDCLRETDEFLSNVTVTLQVRTLSPCFYIR